MEKNGAPAESGTEKKKVAKAAGVVGISTLLSRILGFVRDVVIAWFFGAGMSSDAFFVAFRIPNLLRRLFAEGSLSISFIPVFTEYLNKKGKEEAYILACSAFRSLSVILTLVTIAGILASPLIVHLIAPGFAGDPQKYHLTVFLTKIVFPYIFFICLVALSMGILNVLGHFAAPALAPVFLNLAIIFSALVLAPRITPPVAALAIGVLIGGVLQLLLQVPFLLKHGVRFWKKAPFFHPGLKRVAVLMGPAVFGAAVYQINILVGTLLASLLPEGSVSYLYYADRIVQFPIGIFAIAMATAVLPSLSRQSANKDMQGMADTFSYAIRLILFITLPAMFGLIALRVPIVSLLFKRGEFGMISTQMTAQALLYYCAGLWAFSAVRIAVSTFYSIQDTRTPVITATLSICVNILAGILLMGPMGHAGLALSTSLASVVNLLLLLYELKKRLAGVLWKKIGKSACKSACASVIMGYIVKIISEFLLPYTGKTGYALIFAIGISIFSGIIVYFLLSYLMKAKELETVLALIQQKAGRK